MKFCSSLDMQKMFSLGKNRLELSSFSILVYLYKLISVFSSIKGSIDDGRSDEMKSLKFLGVICDLKIASRNPSSPFGSLT